MRLLLCFILFLLSLISTSPALAFVTHFDFAAPLFPKNRQQCQEMDKEFTEKIKRISQQHDACMTANSKSGYSAGTADIALGATEKCSQASCQSLHTERRDAQKYAREAQVDCNKKVAEYLEQERKNEKDKRDREAKYQAETERRKQYNARIDREDREEKEKKSQAEREQESKKRRNESENKSEVMKKVNEIQDKVGELYNFRENLVQKHIKDNLGSPSDSPNPKKIRIDNENDEKRKSDLIYYGAVGANKLVNNNPFSRKLTEESLGEAHRWHDASLGELDNAFADTKDLGRINSSTPNPFRLHATPAPSAGGGDYPSGNPFTDTAKSTSTLESKSPSKNLATPNLVQVAAVRSSSGDAAEEPNPFRSSSASSTRSSSQSTYTSDTTASRSTSNPFITASSEASNSPGNSPATATITTQTQTYTEARSGTTFSIPDGHCLYRDPKSKKLSVVKQDVISRKSGDRMGENGPVCGKGYGWILPECEEKRKKAR